MAEAGPFFMRLGAEIPNFACKTTVGEFGFHEFCAKSPWTVMMTHPKDYTPVCTTELGRAHSINEAFTKRQCQLIALSCDTLEEHVGWSKDVLGNLGVEGDALDFPIIADESREIVSTLGMLDPLEKDAAGVPLPARGLIILGGKNVRLYILYPATTGRNFDEVLRVIDSLQLTAGQGLASPVDWKQGERLIVAPSVKTEDAKEKFQNFSIKDLPSGKPYLRSVDCPPSKA